MPSITVRNIPEEVRRALRVRAATHGRSTEAEVRDILTQAAKPAGRVKLGTVMALIGRDAKVTCAEVDALVALRNATPVPPMGFK